MGFAWFFSKEINIRDKTPLKWKQVNKEIEEK